MTPENDRANGGTAHLRYRFADATLDVAAHTLEREGRVCTLEPKAFAVLQVLVRHAGELVTRDALLDEVWGHRHVTPGVLTRSIAQLRHVLDDDPHDARVIQTHHALGYRFIAAVETVEPPIPDTEERSDAVPAPSGDAGLFTDRRQNLVRDAGPSSDRRQRLVGRPALVRYRTPIVLALVAVALAVGVLYAMRAHTPPRSSTASTVAPSVAVLPFTVAGRSGERYFAEGLSTELRDALADVPGLRVVTPPPGLHVAGSPRELAKRLQVTQLLDANVRHEGSRLRIDARLRDARDGAMLWSGSFDRDEADVFALQSQIAGEVVQALLGRMPPDAQALQRRLSPTHSVAAYDAYLRGLQLLDAPQNDADLRTAIGHFRQALAADPKFARAQAGICRAEISRFEDARDAAAYERAQSACQRASAMDASLREVSLALGEMYRARGEQDAAIAQYTRALDDPGLRAAAFVGLGRAHGEQGHAGLARGYFEQARRLQPSDPSVFRELGYFEYLQGRVPEAIAAYRNATTLAPNDERLWSSLGGLYLASGDTPHAGEAFERSLAVRPSYPALSNYGSLKYGQRRYAEAATLYRKAADLDGTDFRLWGNLGDALSALGGHDADARAAYERAALLAGDYTAIKPDDAAALAMLGWYRSNLDDAARARALLRRAQALGGEPGEVAFWAAQIAARLQEKSVAVAQLEAARRGGIAEDRLRASPLLRPLAQREGALAASP